MPPLSEDTRRSMLDATARTIRSAVLGSRSAEVQPDLSEGGYNGVFVTVRVRGQLRGCIGFVEVAGPLGSCVTEAARRSCTEDMRFRPVHEDELPDLEFEITLLSPREPLENPREFVIGRHGLMIESGGRRGLLLPQVPVEHGWNTQQFLDGLCSKAGLPRGAWNDADASLWRFEGHMISSVDPGIAGGDDHGEAADTRRGDT